MKDLHYTITRTEKGISVLDIFLKKSFTKTKQEVIDFNTPKAYSLDPQGTPFQKQVWNALQKIKRGETKTYREVAEMIGKPTAVRAVASAIAQNKIAILIPCHRVIRSDGTFGEYRWGKRLKTTLLQNEQNNV